MYVGSVERLMNGSKSCAKHFKQKSTTNIVEIWCGTVVPTESVSSDFMPNEAHSSVTLSLGPVSCIVRALETMYSESAKVAACSGSPASRPTPDLVTNPLANPLGLVKQTLVRPSQVHQPTCFWKWVGQTDLKQTLLALLGHQVIWEGLVRPTR